MLGKCGVASAGKMLNGRGILILWGLLLLPSLSACNTPSPEYLGVEPKTVEQGAYTFKIYQKGTSVQALRTNYGLPSSQADLETAFRIAVGEATGCTVLSRSVSGDAAILNAQIECNNLEQQP